MSRYYDDGEDWVHVCDNLPEEDQKVWVLLKDRRGWRETLALFNPKVGWELGEGFSTLDFEIHFWRARK